MHSTQWVARGEGETWEVLRFSFIHFMLYLWVARKIVFLISFVKKSRSVSNLGTFANLKLEVQFQFSGKFPASCHQQQTGKVIISSQECLTINNIKRIRGNVTKYIFYLFCAKYFFRFFALFSIFHIDILNVIHMKVFRVKGYYCICIFLHLVVGSFEFSLGAKFNSRFWSVTHDNLRKAPTREYQPAYLKCSPNIKTSKIPWKYISFSLELKTKHIFQAALHWENVPILI